MTTNGKIENPFKKLRRLSNMSQAQLAEHLGVTDQTIRRIEQGTFAHVPISIENWFIRNAPYHASEFVSLDPHVVYDKWRTEIRQQAKQHVPTVNPLVWLENYGLEIHPFELWRDDFSEKAGVSEGSVAGFCKKLALEPKQIIAFEAGYSLGLPTEIIKLFHDLEYEHQRDFEYVVRKRHYHFVNGVRVLG